MNKHLTTPLQIKVLKNRQFEGHGSIFGNKDYGGDIVIPGAFERSLAEHKGNGTLPLMFWMHQPDQIPGKFLDMGEDSKGLRFTGELADTQLGNETHTLLKMEAVRGMSIGYMTKDSDYDKDGNRILKDVELFEVSIVSLPMNPKAQITHVKTRLSAIGEYVPTNDEIVSLKRDAEKFLQNKGMYRKLAVACAANLFKDIGEEVILEPIKDEEVILESAKEFTPNELEVNAGLSNFNERMLLLDLDKSLRRMING